MNKKVLNFSNFLRENAEDDIQNDNLDTEEDVQNVDIQGETKYKEEKDNLVSKSYEVLYWDKDEDVIDILEKVSEVFNGSDYKFIYGYEDDNIYCILSELELDEDEIEDIIHDEYYNEEENETEI